MRRPDSIPGAIEDFLQTMRVEAGLRDASIEAYRGDLVAFGRHLVERGVGDLATIDPDDVASFVLAERRRGRAPATVARRIVAIRQWLRHLHGEGLHPLDVAVRVGGRLEDGRHVLARAAAVDRGRAGP